MINGPVPGEDLEKTIKKESRAIIHICNKVIVILARCKKPNADKALSPELTRTTQCDIRRFVLGQVLHRPATIAEYSLTSPHILYAGLIQSEERWRDHSPASGQQAVSLQRRLCQKKKKTYSAIVGSGVGSCSSLAVSVSRG